MLASSTDRRELERSPPNLPGWGPFRVRDTGHHGSRRLDQAAERDPRRPPAVDRGELRRSPRAVRRAPPGADTSTTTSNTSALKAGRTSLRRMSRASRRVLAPLQHSPSRRPSGRGCPMSHSTQGGTRVGSLLPVRRHRSPDTSVNMIVTSSVASCFSISPKCSKITSCCSLGASTAGSE